MYSPFLVFQTKAPHHVWGGISCRGTINIVVFDGIMTATCYGEIIKASEGRG